mmetsp:Transcript_45475/g.99008  ORF Transcript_45475/g.99008 Transcript_45475/m.99008 type:complete len:217 (+) Transcript_45475:1204-1854(+)
MKLTWTPSIIVIFVTMSTRSVMSAAFITTSTSSEMVTLPRQPVTTPPAQSDCPHLENGLKSWHWKSTWGSAGKPTANSDVTIPENTRVHLSTNVRQGVITIPASSELIIGSKTGSSISLEASGIKVYGKLTIGSETCQIRDEITITLTGSRAGMSDDPWYKGIYVTGIIEVHGFGFSPTWTRLAAPVLKGDNVIYLQVDARSLPAPLPLLPFLTHA